MRNVCACGQKRDVNVVVWTANAGEIGGRVGCVWYEYQSERVRVREKEKERKREQKRKRAMLIAHIIYIAHLLPFPCRLFNCLSPSLSCLSSSTSLLPCLCPGTQHHSPANQFYQILFRLSLFHRLDALPFSEGYSEF